MDDPDPLVTLILFVFAVSFILLFLLANSAVSRGRISKLNELNINSHQCVSRILAKRDEYFFSTILALCLTACFWTSWLFLHFLSRTSNVTAFLWVIGLSLLAMAVAFFLAKLVRATVYENPERLLCLLAPPVFWLLQPFLLLVLCSTIPAKYIIRRLGVKLSDYDTPITPDELSELVGLSEEAGLLEEQECEMIRSIFSFSNTLTREVMTPRNDVVTISDNAPLSDIVETFRKHAVSRLVVIGDNLDDVKGLLIAKDLVPLIGKTFDDFSIKNVIRSPCFVKGSKKIDQLFQEMREQRVHLAIVLDEHGGVDGVITVEDLIEELVGEIMDEHDRPEDELQVSKTKSGDLLVSGALLVTDLNEHFELALPPGEYDTVAGYVIHQLGRMPQLGDSVKFNDHVIKVEGTKHNRITRLRIAQDHKPPNTL